MVVRYREPHASHASINRGPRSSIAARNCASNSATVAARLAGTPIPEALYFTPNETDNGVGMANTIQTSPLNIEAVNLDDDREIDAFHEAWIATGQDKVQNDYRRLREMGMVDEHGNQLKTVVSADMVDADADFGG
jgi:hypothetical protein